MSDFETGDDDFEELEVGLTRPDWELLFAILGSADVLLGALISHGDITVDQAGEFAMGASGLHELLTTCLEGEVYPYESAVELMGDWVNPEAAVAKDHDENAGASDAVIRSIDELTPALKMIVGSEEKD